MGVGGSQSDSMQARKGRAPSWTFWLNVGFGGQCTKLRGERIEKEAQNQSIRRGVTGSISFCYSANGRSFEGLPLMMGYVRDDFEMWMVCSRE